MMIVEYYSVNLKMIFKIIKFMKVKSKKYFYKIKIKKKN